MRYFFSLFLLAAFLCNNQYGYAISDISIAEKDVETKFIIVHIPKFEKEKIQLLLAELHSYPGKISDAQFDYATRELTVTYFSTIKLDDILEIVSKYSMDFTKLSGSDLE